MGCSPSVCDKNAQKRAKVSAIEKKKKLSNLKTDRSLPTLKKKFSISQNQEHLQKNELPNRGMKLLESLQVHLRSLTAQNQKNSAYTPRVLYNYSHREKKKKLADKPSIGVKKSEDISSFGKVSIRESRMINQGKSSSLVERFGEQERSKPVPLQRRSFVDPGIIRNNLNNDKRIRVDRNKRRAETKINSLGSLRKSLTLRNLNLELQKPDTLNEIMNEMIPDSIKEVDEPEENKPKRLEPLIKPRGSKLQHFPLRKSITQSNIITFQINGNNHIQYPLIRQKDRITSKLDLGDEVSFGGGVNEGNETSIVKYSEKNESVTQKNIMNHSNLSSFHSKGTLPFGDGKRQMNRIQPFSKFMGGHAVLNSELNPPLKRSLSRISSIRSKTEHGSKATSNKLSMRGLTPNAKIAPSNTNMDLSVASSINTQLFSMESLSNASKRNISHSRQLLQAKPLVKQGQDSGLNKLDTLIPQRRLMRQSSNYMPMRNFPMGLQRKQSIDAQFGSSNNSKPSNSLSRGNSRSSRASGFSRLTNGLSVAKTTNFDVTIDEIGQENINQYKVMRVLGFGSYAEVKLVKSSVDKKLYVLSILI